MRNIEPRAPIPGAIQITYVSPGGLALKLFDEGYVLMRVVLGHLENSEDGLLAEYAEDREPVPWASKAVRDEALASVRGHSALDEDTRRNLVRYVLQTPYYE
jgi:hypothetical protein